MGREIENIGTRESNILDYAGLLSVIAESQLRTEDQAARAVNAALTLRNWISDIVLSNNSTVITTSNRPEVSI